MVQFVKELEEFQAILKEKADKLVVVDFTASWCGPCKVIGPKFEAMAEKSENKDVVVFLKVDVDEAEEIAAFYEVTCMPTFLFFKNNVKVYHFSGANSALLEEKIIELRS